MKNQISILLITAVLAASLSCDGLYTIEKETGERVSFDSYKTIVIGWLDLGEDQWQDHKFKNKEDWLREINHLNHQVLQKKIKELLKGKDLLFAESKKSAFPGRGDLFIGFGDINLEKNWDIVRGGFDYLSVKVTFVEVSSKKAVYSADIKASSLGAVNTKSIERLRGETENLGRFVCKKLVPIPQKN